MEETRQFHRPLTLQPQGVEYHQQTHWQVSANSIVSQHVKNGVHGIGGRESTRLVNKQLSDLWKIPTPEGPHYR